MEQKSRELIVGWISQHKPAMVPPGGLQLDSDLLESGVIDSFDYVSIVEFVTGALGIEVDIADFDDSELGSIAGLAKQIAKLA